MKKSVNTLLAIFLLFPSAAYCAATGDAAIPSKAIPTTSDKVTIGDASDVNSTTGKLKSKDITLGSLPISSATQTALDAKQNRVSGACTGQAIQSVAADGTVTCVDVGGSSMAWPDSDGAYYAARNSAWTNISGLFAQALGADDNYVTDAEKTKIAGIAEGAEVNVNADWNAISGDAQILNKPAIPSSINNLLDVDTTGKATGKILKFDASGNLVVGDDSTGSGSVPSGTVNGQVLLWLTDQWVASTAPWVTTASLGSGVATALGFAPDTSGGFLLYSTYAADPLISWGTGITETADSPTIGTNTISVTNPVTSEAWSGSGWNGDTGGLARNDAYDYLHIADTDDNGLPNKIDVADGLPKVTSNVLGVAIEGTDYLGGSRIDATKGNGDTGYVWPADKSFDELALKRSIADERVLVGWHIKDSDVVTAVADGKQAAVIPASMNGMVLVDFTCSVSDLNSAASGDTTVVLRRVRGATAVDMTSTGVTIAYTDYTASDDVVDSSNDDVATGDKIFPDVNAITSPAQKGLGCTAVFANP